MLEQEIAAVPKNRTEQIKVQLREYNNRPYADLRIYFTKDNGQTWSPTKKGVTINLDGLSELHAALGKAVERVRELRAKGELPPPGAACSSGAEPE